MGATIHAVAIATFGGAAPLIVTWLIHDLTPGRLAGAALMVTGIAPIGRF